MSKAQFPHILQAVEAREKHLGVASSSALWHLGEALKKDIRPEEAGRKADHANDGSRAMIAAASVELDDHGYQEYSPNYLRNILATTEAFPANRRHKELSFSIHVQAQNPDILDWIVKGSGRSATKTDDKLRITERFVKDMVSAWHRRIEEKQRKADEEKEEAAPPKKGKVKKKTRTTKKTKTSKRTMAPPDDEQSTSDIVNEIIVLKELDVLRNAREAKRLADKAKDKIVEAVGKLDQVAVDVLAEACLAAMTAWKQVSDTVRSASANKRSHLTALKGGAA